MNRGKDTHGCGFPIEPWNFLPKGFRSHSRRRFVLRKLLYAVCCGRENSINKWSCRLESFVVKQ